MRELFESSYALTLCKFRLEHYFPLKKRAKSALTRYAEFFTEIGSNIPTVLFIKDGEVKDKTVGAVTKAQLEEKIKALL